MSPDLVVLGNLLVDDVVLPDGRTRFAQPGGACLYLALGAALWGLRVGLVSVLGNEYPAPVLEALAARGVDLLGVRRPGRAGLRTWLLYEGARRRVVHRLEGPSHAEVSPGPADIPETSRSARAFHLAPMHLEIQARLVDAIRSWSPARLSLDPYELFTPGSLAAHGVQAGWLRGEPDERALARGLVPASFAVEAWGADGLLGATPETAERRLREWFPSGVEERG